MTVTTSRLTSRIIAGHLKGRVLELPKIEAARPTRNRILQAAFNLLGSQLDLEGLTVVDLCCGSGAWGLEASSRGAAQVYLIDTETRTAARNVRALGVEGAVQVIQVDAGRWMPPTPLDVVLADPPYHDLALLQKILWNCHKLGDYRTYWLLETAAATVVPWPENFTVLASRVYGVSALHVAVQG